MKNPYEILGVSPSATDNEIKAAYKELALKYSGDIYNNGPLSDIAQKKMAEIDNAYDEIMFSRQHTTNNRGYYSKKTSGFSNANSNYNDVRSHLNSGRIEDAQTILDGIPMDMRDAEWHYLKGVIFYKRGWFEEAINYYKQACEMDPGNQEFQNAYNNIKRRRSGGYRTEQTSRSSSCSFCDICSSLVCADCCCECMGGDLIRCC